MDDVGSFVRSFSGVIFFPRFTLVPNFELCLFIPTAVRQPTCERRRGGLDGDWAAFGDRSGGNGRDNPQLDTKVRVATCNTCCPSWKNDLNVKYGKIGSP